MSKRRSRQAFTIGSVAKQAGVCVETVRYYHRIGLLPRPPLPTGRAVRQYGAETLTQLRFIKRAQRLGFSLEEIGALLALSEGNHCADVQQVARKKLLAVEKKMEELASMKHALLGLLAECWNSGDGLRCPLIDALTQQEQSRARPLRPTENRRSLAGEIERLDYKSALAPIPHR
jgi:MerR family mercuric resistance operon transcriptional regulator